MRVDGIQPGELRTSSPTPSPAEKDSEEASSTDVKMLVYTEKEDFEWREVFRGSSKDL